MSVLKCKVCGADIQLAGDNRLATCQYCGCTMTLPRWMMKFGWRRSTEGIFSGAKVSLTRR